MEGRENISVTVSRYVKAGSHVSRVFYFSRHDDRSGENMPYHVKG